MRKESRQFCGRFQSVPERCGRLRLTNVCKASSEEDATDCSPKLIGPGHATAILLPFWMKYSRIMEDLAGINISGNISIALSRLLMSHQSLVEKWSGPPQDVGLAKLAVFFTTRRADYRSAVRSDGVHALLAGR